jgi:hypothetical protein
VPKFVFLRIIWVTKFHACKNNVNITTFFCTFSLLFSNFVQNVRNYEVTGWNMPRKIVNLSVSSKNSFFFFDFLRMCAAQSAVSAQPQTLELFLLGWLPPSVNNLVHRIAKSDYCLCNVCPSVSIAPWTNSAPTEIILLKFDIWIFFKPDFLKKYDKNNWHLTFMIYVHLW